MTDIGQQLIEKFSKPQVPVFILNLTNEDREILRRWDYSLQFERFYMFAAADAHKAR